MMQGNDLPAVVIEDVSVERSSDPTTRTLAAASVIDVRPPGYDPVKRLLELGSIVRHDYIRTIGVYRGYRPRRASHVEHRIDRSADETIDEVCRRDELRVEVGALRLTCDATHAEYDTWVHEYRVPGRLRLPLSWPALPIVLTIGEVSMTTCKLGLCLHTRRRLRYPLRYFHIVHRILTILEISITTGGPHR